MTKTYRELGWTALQQKAISELTVGGRLKGSQRHSEQDFFRHMLTQLRRIICADEAVVAVLDLDQRRVSRLVSIPRQIRIPRDESFHESFWNDCWKLATTAGEFGRGNRHTHPGHQAAAVFGEVPRTLPLPARRHRARVHGVLGAAAVDVFSLFTTLPVGESVSVRVILFRRSDDFANRDRLMLNLLAPFLLAGYQSFSTAAGQSALTERQREVMLLAARGQTCTDIAEALHLAPGTVRKHFDNIYARLGVTNRVMAVAHAFPHGLPPR